MRRENAVLAIIGEGKFKIMGSGKKGVSIQYANYYFPGIAEWFHFFYDIPSHLPSNAMLDRRNADALRTLNAAFIGRIVLERFFCTHTLIGNACCATAKQVLPELLNSPFPVVTAG